MLNHFGPGDEIVIDGLHYYVTAIAPNSVRCRQITTGEPWAFHPSELYRTGAVQVVGEGRIGTTESTGILETADEAAVKDAEFWQEHIVEVVSGVPFSADAGTEPRSGYDWHETTLAARRRLKMRQLQAAGVSVSDRTLTRKINAYNQSGLAGLIDRRQVREEGPLDRADARIVSALVDLIAAEENTSTGTRSRLISRLRDKLRELYPAEAIDLPSERTLHRFIAELSRKQHTFGDATTRRSRGRTPKRSFGRARSQRPGQHVQIDSTPLDIQVLDEHGQPCRPHLTIMLDIATRTIMGSAIRADSTKAVDLTLLLARTLLPEPCRSGSSERLKLVNSILPHKKMVALDERQVGAVAMPYIVAETITIDNGMDYKSGTFLSACSRFGIGINVSSPYTPTDKPNVERTFEAIKTLFVQYLDGFTGGAPAKRGLDPDDAQLLDLLAVQAVFEEWVVRVWQNRPHDSLFDPMNPSIKYTPNQMYSALFEIAPTIPVPISEVDFIELLPVHWRTIRPDGIQLGNRLYDSEQLAPYRNRKSRIRRQNGKWEVRYYPYDPMTVWVRDAEGTSFIACRWRDADAFNTPFFEETRKAARQVGRNIGANYPDSAETIAEILAATPRAAKREKLLEGRTATVARQDENDYLPRPQIVPETPEWADHAEEDTLESTGTDANIASFGAFDPEAED